MKKTPPRKTNKHRSEHRPIEFDRGWQELEALNDRIGTDWMSLAAQLGVSKGRAAF